MNALHQIPSRAHGPVTGQGGFAPAAGGGEGRAVSQTEPPCSTGPTAAASPLRAVGPLFSEAERRSALETWEAWERWAARAPRGQRREREQALKELTTSMLRQGL